VLRECEVCGSSRVRVLRHSDVWHFDVARCADCRMVFVLDPPPPEDVEGAYIEGGDCTPYVDIQRDDDRVRPRVLDRLAELLGPAPAGGHRLFDIGAGVGDFMAQAQQHGFAVSGNEISPVAIDYTRERHGFELSPLLLDEQEPESVDAITMWCVLAHVNDPEALLRDALAMLRPGGVLFLRTPRWCLIDQVGTAAHRLSRGRLSGLADRRVSVGHMHLYTADNLSLLMRKSGFTDVDAQPACHFPLSTDSYLESSGAYGKALARCSRGLDALIQRDRFIRNTLLVYARRPA
jgi:SAM-dependent methyltransferase